MLCRLNAKSVKALLFALVALAACITPAASQIHWNRGWGAGGSMGKRSSSTRPAVSSASNTAAYSSSIEEYLLNSDCTASNLSYITSLFAKLVESEITRLAACEVRDHLASSSSSSSSEQDRLSPISYLIQGRKGGVVAPTDQ